MSTHFDRSLLSRNQRFFFEFGIQITGEQLQSNLDQRTSRLHWVQYWIRPH
jgi:hypothetical protein